MPDGEYVGRPWRARFLRAPKMALQIEARPEFVPLGRLAEVSLGLKTGADSFFFLTPVSDAPRRVTLSATASARAALRVSGHNGWEGEIAARDLLPAIRNPHELFRGDDRRFTIAGSAAVYLLPRDRVPSGDLAEYIRHGERDGLHKRDLVKSNASTRGWYRQVRAVVRSRWALPYNSAYDYGAWDNPQSAVLNGRFVGVSARPDVDEDLLGAALNSTWVMALRLLEGVATGSEGAFDVGPPAARLMGVPDVRKATGTAARDARDLVAEMRRTDCTPPGPDSRGHVQDLRRDLDLAVLCAVGVHRGEAALLQGQLYENYARWRGAVEAVEATTRMNRSNTRRQGQGRGVSPTQMAARTIWEQLAPDFRVYPTDFLRPGDEMEEVAVRGPLPSAANQPLFEAEIIRSLDGPVNLGSWDRVRYLSTLGAIGFETPFFVPRSATTACRIADAFEVERQRFRAEASTLARAMAPAATVEDVVAVAEGLWHRSCRAAGMGTAT